jgi:hypothetical protein
MQTSAGHLASHSAVGLSIISLLLCFGYIPIMWSRMANIQNKLRLGADEFKVLEDDAWMQLRQLRGDAPRSRPARQAQPQCQCDSTDRCPPGPGGAPG